MKSGIEDMVRGMREVEGMVLLLRVLDTMLAVRSMRALGLKGDARELTMTWKCRNLRRAGTARCQILVTGK